MTDLAVLIAAADLLPTLKSRLGVDASEVLEFTEGEALRALELITTRRPPAVYLERKFASTPRGAALINRIKADPSLVETEIRVIDAAGQDQPESAAIAPAPQVGAAGSSSTATAAVPAPHAPALDFRGTRRTPRFRIGTDAEILVDGNRGLLVDISTLGAQLVTQTILKPNQRVRMALADDERPLRCSATVVWASFEIPAGASPRYRAGLYFVEPDTAAIEGYIARRRR